MAIESRSELKKHFQTGMIPTEGDFGNLMDSFIHKADDGISKSAGSPLTIETSNGNLAKVIEFYKTAISLTSRGTGLKGITSSRLDLEQEGGIKLSLTLYDYNLQPDVMERSGISFHDSKSKVFENAQQQTSRIYKFVGWKDYDPDGITQEFVVANTCNRFMRHRYFSEQTIKLFSKYDNIEDSDQLLDGADKFDLTKSSLELKASSIFRIEAKKNEFKDLAYSSEIKLNACLRDKHSIDMLVGGRMMFTVTPSEVKSKVTIVTDEKMDFAEFLESAQNQPILIGYSVFLTEKGKIRPAAPGETPIGIISANPAILGNSPDEWPKKYLRDDFGTPIMEEVEEEIADSPHTSEMPENKALATPRKVKVMRPKLNPDYDPNQTYTPRRDRPEWHMVGLLGQIPLRKGQPVAPTWVKIKDISENVELWLVK